ncbi:MAG TPA: DMT family transporter [Gemmatimonadaceae bacterium]
MTLGRGRATALIAFSACCFGSIPVLVTLASQAGSPLVNTLAWRFAIAAVLLFGLGGSLARAGVERKRLATLVFGAGAGQALINGLSLSALRWIPAATLTFLFYTYPAWVTVFAVVRRTERLTPLRVVALLLSLAGIGLMVGAPGSAELHPLGLLLALSSAVAYAAYIPFLGRLQVGIAPAAAAGYTAVGASVAFFIVGAATRSLVLDVGARGWLPIAAIAVFSTALAFVAFLRGLAVLGPVRTAIVSTIEPFWAGILAALVLGQRIGPGALAGGALIATAVILLQRGGASEVADTSPPAPATP